MVTGTVSLDR